MIEANDDISLVTERQLRDVEQAQAQAKAIAEGREEHPAKANLVVESVSSDTPQPTEQVRALVQPPSAPPPDPDTAMRHLRISIVAVIVLVLFFLWLRQKKS